MDFPWFLSLYYYLANGTYPSDATKVIKQKIRRQAKKYSITGEFLVENESSKRILHDGNIREVLLKLHQEGHLGGAQLYQMASYHYVYHKKLFKACKEIAKECVTCQMRARPVYKRRNLARPIRTPSTPFFMVGCDAVGPLEETKGGNKYILTGIDYLTRWPIALAVPNINEETTTEFYYNQIVALHGVPNYILTDRGSNFASVFTKTFLSKLGCKAITTTSYRPQTNGLCERLNQTLCATLAKLARDQNGAKRWDEYVNQALLALRTLFNESMKFSPSQLLYGFQMITPAAWQNPIYGYVEGEYEVSVAQRVEFVQGELLKIRREARDQSNKAKEKQERRYNRTVHIRTYGPGEQVLLKEEVLSNKFADKWSGPYVVIEVLNNGTYLLDGARKGRVKHAINGDSLKAFSERKFMVPDVGVQGAMERFKVWVDANGASKRTHLNQV